MSAFSFPGLLIIGLAVPVNVVGSYSLKSLQVVPAVQFGVIFSCPTALKAPPLHKATVDPIGDEFRVLIALAIVCFGEAVVPGFVFAPGTQSGSAPVPQSQ